MTGTPQLEVPLEGLFLSPTPPWGASVLVMRDGSELLLVRRGHAWGPPAVTRLPDEPIATCAARALDEIVGLALPMWPVADVDPAWAIFLATTDDDSPVRLAGTSDAYEWVSIDEAHKRCTDLVSATLARVA